MPKYTETTFDKFSNIPVLMMDDIPFSDVPLGHTVRKRIQLAGLLKFQLYVLTWVLVYIYSSYKMEKS